VVFAALAACSVTNLVDPRSVSARDVLTVHPDSTVLGADGVSRTRVTAKLGVDTPDGVDVAFRASGGQFLGADGNATRSVTVKAAGRQAVATYVADTRAAPVTLSASIGTVMVDTIIALRAAPPSEILLVPGKRTAKATGADAIELRATLFAADPARVVSRGTRVDFIAVDSASGVELSELRGAAILEGDRVTEVKHLLTSREVRTVRVTASVTNAQTTTTSNPVFIAFVP